MRAVGLALMACRLGLMTCATVGSWQIRSKFVIEQGDDKIIDVTLRTGDPRSGCEGCFGSVSLTVLDARTGAPTIFLKLADVASGRSSDGSFGTGPPAVLRQGSGYRLIQKTVKRWKPCLATELDRFLGEGAVRDRMLLVELLDVDDAKEMPDVMNLYRIPMQHFEAWLGSRYDASREGNPRPLIPPSSHGGSGSGAAAGLEATLEEYVGKRVLFPSERIPEALQEDGDVGSGLLLYGRLERMRGADQCVVAVTGDDETSLLPASDLLRPPTQEENMADARKAAEDSEAARGEREAAAAAEAVATAAAKRGSGGTGGGHGAASPGHNAPSPSPSLPAADVKDPVPADTEDEQRQLEAAIAASLSEGSGQPQGASNPTGGGSGASTPPEPMVDQVPEVTRVEYTPAAGWEESEMAARKALADRMAAKRAVAPVEREPEGMDSVLQRSEVIQMQETGDGSKVPVSTANADGSNVTAAIRRTPGYDLVRVGNFTEKTAGEPADIAFFHNFQTLH